MTKKKTNKEFSFIVPNDDQLIIDIEGFASADVMVETWCHSGLVRVTLKGVHLIWLLEKIKEEIVAKRWK